MPDSDELPGAGMPSLPLDGHYLEVVRFQAGGWDAAIAATAVAGMERKGAGETSDGAEIEPVEALLGLPAATAPQTRTLMLRGDARRIRVGEPVQLSSLPVASIFPIPEFIRHRCGMTGLRAFAFVEERMVLLFELALDGT